MRMPFCSKCGTEVFGEAKFCPNCGAPILSTAKPQIPTRPAPPKTGLDMIGSDQRLQEYWIKRGIAFIIDAIAVLIAVIIIGVIATIIFFPFAISFSWFWGWWQFSLVGGLLFILYFTFAESIYGYTLGKKVMGFQVVTVGGRKPDFVAAFIRNLSKIFIILLLLDVVGGFITHGDPHQKYTDRIAGANIINIA